MTQGVPGEDEMTSRAERLTCADCDGRLELVHAETRRLGGRSRHSPRLLTSGGSGAPATDASTEGVASTGMPKGDSTALRTILATHEREYHPDVCACLSKLAAISSSSATETPIANPYASHDGSDEPVSGMGLTSATETQDGERHERGNEADRIAYVQQSEYGAMLRARLTMKADDQCPFRCVGTLVERAGNLDCTTKNPYHRIAGAAARHATPTPDDRDREVERIETILHELDGTQHYVTHEYGYDGDDIEGVTCATGIEGHRDDARSAYDAGLRASGGD